MSQLFANFSLVTCSLDITVMAHFGAQERTVENWQALVERAGLKIAGIWSLPGNHESVIEVVPV